MDFNNFDDFVICHHENVKFMNHEMKYKICLLTVILQPRRLLTNLKNESFPNKAIYSSFPSVEPTDFKNAIQIKIQWGTSEAAEV